MFPKTKREGSGCLLSEQRQKEIADQNLELLNKIYRIICRDN